MCIVELAKKYAVDVKIVEKHSYEILCSIQKDANACIEEISNLFERSYYTELTQCLIEDELYIKEFNTEKFADFSCRITKKGLRCINRGYVYISCNEENTMENNKIFIVHGRTSSNLLNEIQNLLYKNGLEPIILAEQNNQGKTLPEKIDQYSKVSYAIIILGPDDKGKLKDDKGKYKLRARQNVILELGFFWGKLGRENLFILTESEDIELPTDISGMGYTYTGNNWEKELAKSLESRGYKIDIQKL